MEREKRSLMVPQFTALAQLAKETLTERLPVRAFLILLAEILFKPRLDFGRESLILWYGRNKRNYFEIYRS